MASRQGGTLTSALAVLSRIVMVMAAALAQPAPDAYRDVLAAYRNGGDLEGVIDPLREWQQDDFEKAVNRLMVRGDRAELEAAVILQLEFGLAVVGQSVAATRFHFDLAATLIDRLRNAYKDPGIVTFAATCFAVAGSGYLAIYDIGRARPLIERAVSLTPRSAAILTLAGIVDEMWALMLNPELLAESNAKIRSSMERRRRVSVAIESYEKAVAYDPAYAPAQLRLARARLLLGELAPARVAALRAEVLAAERADRYLSALTLGAILEREKDLAGARRAYERALAVVPGAQTATVAVSYLDVITGRPDSARARVQAFVDAPLDDPYWWEFNNGGVYHAGLRELRARIGR